MDAVFWRSLFPHAAPIAFLMPWMTDRWFADDVALIRHLADVRSMQQFDEAVKVFLNGGFRNWSRGRQLLKLRISKRRLRSLASRYLPRREELAGVGPDLLRSQPDSNSQRA